MICRVYSSSRFELAFPYRFSPPEDTNTRSSVLSRGKLFPADLSSYIHLCADAARIFPFRDRRALRNQRKTGLE
jgi:hypothetical protein